MFSRCNGRVDSPGAKSPDPGTKPCKLEYRGERKRERLKQGI